MTTSATSATNNATETVLVLDFGAQYGQLIARRVRDLKVYSEIVPCDTPADEIAAKKPAALILSGGPASVYAEDAPSVDPGVFELGVPVLGFCYGQQIMATTLGGTVGHTEKGEYGPAPLTRCDAANGAGTSALFGDTPAEQTVWMSHRDAVSEVPEGFVVTSTTDVCPVALTTCCFSIIYPHTEHFFPLVNPSSVHVALTAGITSTVCFSTVFNIFSLQSLYLQLCQ